MNSRFAGIAASLGSAIRSIPGSIERNVSVIRIQWVLYGVECRTVIIPGIKKAHWHRKFHKCFAFVEEFYDKCPRIAAYLDWLRVPLEVAGVAWLIL